MSTKVIKKATRLRDIDGVTVSDRFNIDPSIIEVEQGHNPRDFSSSEAQTSLSELKANIKQRGVKNPVWVRFDKVTNKAILVDGERRLRCVLELISEGVPIKTIPAIQVEGGNEGERLILALTANTGKPLNSWEKGLAYKRLLGYGWTEEKISTDMGVSQRSITEALELADAPLAITEMLKGGQVSPSLALSHLRNNGAGAVRTLQDAVAKAQANGQVIAKRARTTPTQDTQLRKLVDGLFDDVTSDELKEDVKFVQVNRQLLVQIGVYLGISKCSDCSDLSDIGEAEIILPAQQHASA